MGQEKFEEKLKVLKEIAKEVNSEEIAKIGGIENDVLVAVSDIEGRAKDFLVKLKHAGVIDWVEVDEKTGKLKILLNKDFCGTIDFCGDLTAYKDVGPFGNEIVIEVFEELLEQIKEHNKDKDKDKQIQFVAVPGNHEFYDFWGGQDELRLRFPANGEEAPLLVKLKSLKVIAEIQKYFLQQVCDNKDDITDDDYQGTDVDIEKRSESLDKECKMLDTIYDVLSGKGADLDNVCGYFISYNVKKAELQQEKDCFKNGCFMIKTKGGKITNEKCTDKKNRLVNKDITKDDLNKIFTNEVCCLPFKDILEILESNGKYQENNGEDTEWTEDLINEKLNDLKNVLKNKNFVFNIEEWPHYRDDWAQQLTSIKNLETKLESFKTTTQELEQQLLREGYIEQGDIKDENPISMFRPLFWDKSALLSKIVFNHHGKKFRTLHHFGLFVPEDKSADELTKDNQKNIFADAFSKLNYFNINALGRPNLRHLKRNIFENNKIPTLFGHEGIWRSDVQTSNMYCVDDGYTDSCGVVCVVDRKNEIRPYYTAKSIKYSQEHNDDNPLKLGYYDKEACKKLVIYDCKPQDNISIINKYVESGQQPSETIVNAIDAIIQSKDVQKIEDYVNGNTDTEQQDIANTIASLINRDRDFLEKYRRIFAFSQKDKRAQQVYQTYKMLTESQNEINTSKQPKPNQTMIELNSIHSINTPCGGCF